MAEKKISFIDKALDFTLSKDSAKWILLILLIGFILRFLVASNATLVPDEAVHGTHAIGIISLNPLSTMTQCPIWFFLTDLAYTIFGVNFLGARFTAFFFGALSIVLVYLLVTLFSNKKTALVAAFLFAISPYHIGWLAIYMDQSMMFFILLAAYYFLKEYQDSKKISVISAVFLGIAILIKIIAAVFTLVFIGFILYILYKNYKNDKALFKINFKKAMLFAVILFLSVLPLLVYNYLLYNAKGLVDLPFAQYFNINREFYEGPGLAHGSGFFSFSAIINNIFAVFKEYFFKHDPLLFILAILGIPFFYQEYKKNKFPIAFLTIMFAFAFIFLILSIVLQTHYTSFCPLLAILGALSIVKMSEYFQKYVSPRKFITVICLVMLIFSVFYLWGSLTSKSGIDKMRTFAVDKVSDDDLVVVDSRIYRGYTAWMFNDKHYIDASQLSQVIEYTKSLPNYQTRTVPVKFVECAIDDCGWGTISSQPELNTSMEGMTALFKNLSSNSQEIMGGGVDMVKRGEIKGEPYFRVYYAHIELYPAIAQLVDQTHEFFFYPVRRNLNPEKAYDYYDVNGFFNNSINALAYLVLYSLLAIALVSPLIVFYNLIQNNKPEQSVPSS